METVISRTKIKSRAEKKTNRYLAEAVIAALKNKNWSETAKLISSSTRRQSRKNLFEIDKESKEGDTVVIAGKVLSNGNLTKKLTICALAISKTAMKKLKDTKSAFVPLLEEIKKNPKAEGIKILK